MGKGQELWKKAKELMPGGSQLFSKRSEFFAPEQWPAYYSRAEGAYVWDLDGKKYLDVFLKALDMSEEEFNRIALTHVVAPYTGPDFSKVKRGPELSDQKLWTINNDL